MVESEPMTQCPKGCGTSLPLSQMHEHYESCLGKPSNPLSVVPIWPTQPTITVPKVPAPPIEVPKPKLIKEEIIYSSFCKKCGTQYIETAMYKVCTKCKDIKVKARMWWWIILRYGMMIGWLSLFIGFILGITTYHSVIKP